MGFAVVCFCQVAPGSRKLAKFASKDRICMRLALQFSKAFTVSLVVNGDCFGARVPACAMVISSYKSNVWMRKIQALDPTAATTPKIRKR